MDPIDLAHALTPVCPHPGAPHTTMCLERQRILLVHDQEVRESTIQNIRRRLGVIDPCDACGGFGNRTYSSGATWRGGMGTAACTTDVCDRCWGSGDASRPREDLRKREAELDARVQRLAGKMLPRELGMIPGMRFRMLAPAVPEVAAELKKLARGRKKRPEGFHGLVTRLATYLEKLVANPPD